MTNANIPCCLRLIGIIIIFAAINPGNTIAQTDTSKANSNLGPKVFLDCYFCDIDYIKQNLPYVNYVRDRKVADVHVLFISQRTGSGGREYQLTFTGIGRFNGINDTLTCNADPNSTYDEKREIRLQTLTIGLIRYVAHTPAKEFIFVEYDGPDSLENAVDKWNNWVFEINAGGEMEGQEVTKYYAIEATVRADKITEKWKIELEAGLDYEEYRIKEDSAVDIYPSEWKDFDVLIVRSITDHWSVGSLGSIESSIFNNYNLRTTLQPGIEFNVFPYSESSRRQLRFFYGPLFVYNEYVEITIYDKYKEILVANQIYVGYRLQENWGTINIRGSGSHYFHDFSKYSITLGTWLSLKVSKGLSIYVEGSASLIRDQIMLPQEGASQEDILLQRQVLATNYRFSTSLGISYTFGSIYNSIVNPRF